MSLARTNQGHWEGYSAGSSFTTGTFTPPNSSLLVFFGYMLTNGGSSDDSASIAITDNLGSPLIYTRQKHIGDPNYYASGMAVWTAPVATGAPMAVTISSTNLPWVGAMADAVAYTGYNTSTPVGATVANATLPFTGAGSITLSGTPASSSEVIASLYLKLNPSGTGVTVKGSGWTELYNINQGSSNGLSYQTQVMDGLGSPTVPWADVDNAGANSSSQPIAIALEIQAAGATIQSADLYAGLDTQEWLTDANARTAAQYQAQAMASRGTFAVQFPVPARTYQPFTTRQFYPRRLIIT